MTRRFSTADLENLTKGTTPGPWEASVHAFTENEGGGYSIHAEVADKDGVPLMYAEDAFVFHRESNFTLAAAAPDLVYALIAEKQAHAELRKRIEDRIRKLKQPLCSHMPEGDELDEFVEQWERQNEEARILTRILNGDTDD